MKYDAKAFHTPSLRVVFQHHATTTLDTAETGDAQLLRRCCYYYFFLVGAKTKLTPITSQPPSKPQSHGNACVCWAQCVRSCLCAGESKCFSRCVKTRGCEILALKSLSALSFFHHFRYARPCVVGIIESYCTRAIPLPIHSVYYVIIIIIIILRVEYVSGWCCIMSEDIIATFSKGSGRAWMKFLRAVSCSWSLYNIYSSYLRVVLARFS